MEKRRASMSPEQKLFNFMIVVRFFMLVLVAVILGGLDFTSVFPSGETVSVVNLSLRTPWIVLAIIAVVTVVKYILFHILQGLVENDGPTMLVYSILVVLQLIKMVLWILMLVYVLYGYFIDTRNWGILATPLMLYLFLEAFYTCAIIRSEETE